MAQCDLGFLAQRKKGQMILDNEIFIFKIHLKDNHESFKNRVLTHISKDKIFSLLELSEYKKELFEANVFEIAEGLIELQFLRYEFNFESDVMYALKLANDLLTSHEIIYIFSSQDNPLISKAMVFE